MNGRTYPKTANEPRTSVRAVPRTRETQGKTNGAPELDPRQAGSRTGSRVWTHAGGGFRLTSLIAAVAALHAVGTVATAQSGAGGKTTRVVVSKAVVQELTRELRLPATLMPDEAVDLMAKTSGYVVAVNVDIGDRVRKDTILVVIDVPEMVNELHQAEAMLKAKEARVRAVQAKATKAQRMVETARAKVRRYEAEHQLDEINLTRRQTLRDGNAIPEQSLDEARSAHAITKAQLEIAAAEVAGAQAEKLAVNADVEVAQADVLVSGASVARLRTLMGYAEIKAPFDGVITDRLVDPGAFVRSAAEGTTLPLLRIAKTDKLRVTLNIPESDVPFVRPGTKVQIDIRSMREEPFQATVTRIAAAIRPETRTMLVEIDLDNQDGRFTPGMYAQVALQLGGAAKAVLVPSKAIRVRGRETSVLIASNGRAEFRKVAVGYDDGIRAEITAGLQGGELLITSGGNSVADGTRVEAVLEDS
ncbi:MAG: efflux RND transporter periplasmic adaptor subunit [Planctomycetes bacterium]|nr:efflux RND transporter periplasmic adaptor subunit [Planctomycetota bacterium]